MVHFSSDEPGMNRFNEHRYPDFRNEKGEFYRRIGRQRGKTAVRLLSPAD